MLKLDMTLDVKKMLEGLDSKRFRQVVSKIFDMMRDPRPNDSSPLKGYDNWFRADIGEFRIINEFDDSTLYLLLVGKRNDDEIYKTLRRKD